MNARRASQFDEFLGQVIETHGLDVVRQQHAFNTRLHDQATHWFEIIAGDVEPALHLGREAAFDLDCPELATRKFQQKVDLCSGGRAIVERRSPRWRAGDQCLDNEALPARPNDRVIMESVSRRDRQQRVKNAAISQIDLGRLDQTLAENGVKGLQSPDQQQVDQ
jgi:hypothetical protein